MNVLEVKGLTKSFGGLMAVKEVALTIKRKEICSIIGPNGAGKTTLFNLLSNRYAADDGKIIFEGKEINGIPPHKLIDLGIGRTFQITNIFPKLSVFENVQAAVIKNQRQSLSWFRPISKIKDIQNATYAILEEIGLADKSQAQSSNLPYGDQRRIEIGITLANNPSLLLLDEPTAGMAPEETKSTVDFIQKLNDEHQITIIIIEHDMDVVFSISTNIYVMYLGGIIAYGTPDEISQNQEVIDAYLGG